MILATIVTINVFPNKTIDRFNTVIANATQFIENENDNKKQQSGSASERFIFWTASINTVKK
jgi:hypothetical protein